MGFAQHEKRLTSRLDEDKKTVYSDLKHRLSDGTLNLSDIDLGRYVDYGCQHAKNIIVQISSMIPDHILEKMGSFEVLILLCSAWLHDIGLFAETDEKGQALSDEKRRKRHHELSRFIIRKMHNELGIDDVGLAYIIADICYCHRRKIDIRQKLTEIDLIQTEKVRQQFLAAVLRLADAFGITTLKPSTLFSILCDSSEEILKMHVKACELIQAVSYEIERYSIVIKAYFKEKEDERILKWKIIILFEEFESVKEILIKNELLYLYLHQKVRNLYIGKEKESTEKPELPAEERPTEVILNEWRQNENFHIKRKEYIFAADYCWRSYQLLLKRGEKNRASGYISRAIKYVEATKGHPDRRYFLRILHKYYSILNKKLENVDLSPKEQTFFDDISFIQRSLNTIEKKFLTTYEYPYKYKLLFEMGRSPLRERIKAGWKDYKEENIEEDGSLDSGCSQCTANYVIISTLMGEKEEAKRSVEWLCNQKDNEWRTKNDTKCGFDYTSSCLTALFEWYYPDHENVPEISDIANFLLRNRANWGNVGDFNYVIIHTDILFPLSLLWVRCPELPENIHKAIKKELLGFSDLFQNAPDSEQEDSLRGILFFDKIIDEEKRRKMKELAEETIGRMRHNPNWNKKTGMWGSETLNRTGNKIYNWLHYWELTLKMGEKGD